MPFILYLCLAENKVSHNGDGDQRERLRKVCNGAGAEKGGPAGIQFCWEEGETTIQGHTDMLRGVG